MNDALVQESVLIDAEQDTAPVRKEIRLRRKPPTIPSLLLRMFKGVDVADQLLNDPDPAMRLRAVHALTQAGSVYARTYETGDLQKRVEALEEALKRGQE